MASKAVQGNQSGIPQLRVKVGDIVIFFYHDACILLIPTVMSPYSVQLIRVNLVSVLYTMYFLYTSYIFLLI